MSDIYYIYQPDWNGVTEYKTKQEWLQAIKDFDFLGQYCDDGWSEEVINVTAGISPYIWDEGKHESIIDECDFYDNHATYEVVKVNERQKPPDNELDENEEDEHGIYWGEFDFMCSYEFQEKTK